MNFTDKWCVIQCKARETFRAELNLTNQGFECFHPTHVIKRKRLGTIQSVVYPLFPFYVFTRLSRLDQWSKVRSTRGVNKVVYFSDTIATIEQNVIDALKYHCDKLNNKKPETLFKKGDRVLITDGCFKEIEAIVTTVDSEERVKLLLSLFNRPQEIELPLNMLKVC